MVDNLIKKEKFLRILLFGFILLFLFAIVYFVSFQMSGNVIFHSFDYVEEVPVADFINLSLRDGYINCNFSLNYSNEPIIIHDNEIKVGKVDDIYRSLFCDDTNCYGISNINNFLLQINHLNGVVNSSSEIGNLESILSPNFIKPYEIYVDSDFIVLLDQKGYLIKKSTSTGEFIYNITDGPGTLINDSSGNYLTVSFCDDTNCYGVKNGGNFLKINHITGEIIFDYEDNNQISTTSIDSLLCDDTYCYAMDNEGYFIKINHVTGEHIYNRTSGSVSRLSNGTILDGMSKAFFLCDDTYCYAMDQQNLRTVYFLKINHVTGEHIYNNTEGYLNKIYNVEYKKIYDFSCDNTYCYMGLDYYPDSEGYLFKIDHITGEHVYNTTEGYKKKLSDNSLNFVKCLGDYCYILDNSSKFIKFNLSSGQEEFNYTILGDYYFEDYIGNLFTDYLITGFFCNEDYCYLINDKGYFMKLDHNKYPLFANIQWYENDSLLVSDSFSNLNSFVDKYNSNLTLLDGISLGNNYYCSVIPFYDSESLGEELNSETIYLEHINSAIVSFQVDQLDSLIYLNMSYTYPDDYNDFGNVYVDWYLNGGLVESDIISNTLPNEEIITYFNFSKSEGDEINVKISVQDDFLLSSNFTFPTTVFLNFVTLDEWDAYSTSNYNPIHCDETYCYYTDANFRGKLQFLKVNKETGEKIYDAYESTSYLSDSYDFFNDFTCDNEYCYGVSANSGLIYKINKETGENFFNSSISFSSGSFQGDSNFYFSCNEIYCYYIINPDNKLEKVNKETGEVIIYETSPEVSSFSLLSFFCYNDTYCYVSDVVGGLTKIDVSQESVYSISNPFYYGEMGSELFGISCDNEFCYGMTSFGCFIKINHNSGEISFGLDEEDYCEKTISLDGFESQGSWAETRLICDDSYCYTVDNGGSFLVINSYSGEVILGEGDFVIPTSEELNSETFYPLSLFKNNNSFSLAYESDVDDDSEFTRVVYDFLHNNEFYISPFTISEETENNELEDSEGLVEESGESVSSIHSSTKIINNFIEKDLIEEKQLNLAYKSEVSLKIKNNNHKLVIEEIGNDSATISIFSEKQTKQLSVGEEWKVNLDNDNYYDLSVKLNSVLNGIVNLSIKSIQEQINEDEINNIEEETPYESQDGKIELLNVIDLILIVLLLIVLILIFYKVVKRKK